MLLYNVIEKGEAAERKKAMASILWFFPQYNSNTTPHHIIFFSTKKPATWTSSYSSLSTFSPLFLSSLLSLHLSSLQPLYSWIYLHISFKLFPLHLLESLNLTKYPFVFLTSTLFQAEEKKALLILMAKAASKYFFLFLFNILTISSSGKQLLYFTYYDHNLEFFLFLIFFPLSWSFSNSSWFCF